MDVITFIYSFIVMKIDGNLTKSKRESSTMLTFLFSLKIYFDKYSKTKTEITGQIAQVVRSSLLVREEWDSNHEPTKFPTRCQ